MNTMRRIVRFMNQTDSGGGWQEFYKMYRDGEVDRLNAVARLHETLFIWMEDGLELTPRIEEYLDYLEAEMEEI